MYSGSERVAFTTPIVMNKICDDMEFHRWFDLKRTNRALTVLTAKGKAVTADKLLLPVPEIVRTQNPAITQNAAYK
jgi:hypothetical protein